MDRSELNAIIRNKGFCRVIKAIFDGDDTIFETSTYPLGLLVLIDSYLVDLGILRDPFEENEE